MFHIAVMTVQYDSNLYVSVCTFSDFFYLFIILNVLLSPHSLMCAIFVGVSLSAMYGHIFISSFSFALCVGFGVKLDCKRFQRIFLYARYLIVCSRISE